MPTIKMRKTLDLDFELSSKDFMVNWDCLELVGDHPNKVNLSVVDSEAAQKLMDIA